MKRTIEKICERVYKNGLRFNGLIPTNSTDADGLYSLKGGGWTDGFYIGMVYLAYAYTKDKKFLDIADKYQTYFRLRAENNAQWCKENGILPLDHDTGFIFKLSQVYRYKLTKDPEARMLALKAADKLASRFNSAGGFIRAWNTWDWDTDPQFIEEKKGKMIIDSMMNIALLFWAANESGNKHYEYIASVHADTIAKYIVRSDNSTYHQFNFDPVTGKPIKGVTGQGYSDESCWSRGQAWAIYGFCETYGYTKNTLYLDIAEKTSLYFINHLLPDGLPLWDFSCKKLPFRPIDASAAAIALSGMISLEKYRPTKEISEGIKKLMNGLLTQCNALSIDDWESVLLHGCIGSAYQKDSEHTIIVPYIDCPLIYADYYFFEALLKAENLFEL